MNPRISMREIAKDLRLSVTTVSYALRNDRRVNAVTKERILQRARELGYTPDPALAILNAYRRDRVGPRYAGNLAFLVSNPEVSKDHKDHYIYQYYLGAEEAAKSLGYNLEWYTTWEKGLTGQRLSQILAARGVRGLIVSPLPEGMSALDLEWSLFSSVCLGHSLKDPHLHRVCSDQFKCTFLCIEKLRALGYERIGHIVSEPERTDWRYMGAYLAARRKFGLSRVTMLEKPDFTESDLRHWIESENIDAVIGSSYGHLQMLKRVGLGHIGFALPFHSNDPTVACSEDRWFDVAHASASILVQLIQRNETGIPTFPFTHLLDPMWRQGALSPKSQ